VSVEPRFLTGFPAAAFTKHLFAESRPGIGRRSSIMRSRWEFGAESARSSPGRVDGDRCSPSWWPPRRTGRVRLRRARPAGEIPGGMVRAGRTKVGFGLLRLGCTHRAIVARRGAMTDCRFPVHV